MTAVRVFHIHLWFATLRFKMSVKWSVSGDEREYGVLLYKIGLIQIRVHQKSSYLSGHVA